MTILAFGTVRVFLVVVVAPKFFPPFLMEGA